MPIEEDRPRRFYKTADVRSEGEGFAVTLDGRYLRTPKKVLLALPSETLARHVAGEWDSQGETIIAETMPVTRLANVALDFTPGARDEMAANVAKYGESDLCSHRASNPGTLVARQRASWDPLLAWAEDALGVSLAVGEGILALDQPAAALEALNNHARALDDFALTGLAHATGLAGSAVIGFALQRGHITAEQAYDASALDEIHQIETWGEDDEARKRLNLLRMEMEALERFFRALA